MRLFSLIVVGCALCLGPGSHAQDLPADSAHADAIVIPELVPDPLEPINRSIWSFNTVVNNRLLHPIGEGYRFIVREPVRDKINNFARNLSYPQRLINNALQGQWRGAHQETRRFVVNSTIGIAGLFDPATSLGIEKSDADFGQTFGRWGWKPGLYFVIPLLGPSNERDGIGMMGDIGVHPLVYFSPYSYGLYGLSFNYLVDKTAELKRITRSGADSYAYARQAASYVRDNDVSQFRITEMPKEPALSSLNAVFFTHGDDKFPERAKTRSVRIPATGEKLKYSLWLHDRDDGTAAPVVYMIPGLGGQRLERPSLALAELVHSQGYSVVSVSSLFNAEFIESAATAAVPGYSTVDNRDLHVALDAIDRDLRSKYGDRTGQRVLMGFSMGGFHTMMLAAQCETEPSDLVRFDRYVAINPPVDLMYGLATLDGFYNAALSWPADQRTAKIDYTFRKVAALLAATAASEGQPNSGPPPMLPFDRTESGFLIGYTYRTVLRDIIYASQSRHNLGILQQPLSRLRRADVYEEIAGYSYTDYLETFVIPYYQSGGSSDADVRHASDLKNCTAGLRRVTDLRIIASADDFLLQEGDISWLRSLVPAERITVFGDGGHMGSLAADAGQLAVIQSLGGL